MNASRHRFAFAMATFGLRASLVTLPEGMAGNDWYAYNVYILCVQLCIHHMCLYIRWSTCLSSHTARGYAENDWYTHNVYWHTLRVMYVYNPYTFLAICIYIWGGYG